MPCACEQPCEEPLQFRCAWCGSSDGAPDPACLRYNRRGKCIEFAEGFTPDPATCNDGRRARLTVRFPAADALSTSGDGSWLEPPGGPNYWFNVSGGNDAPADHDDVEIDVDSGDDAMNVRDAAGAALAGFFDVVPSGEDVLILTRLASGAEAFAQQSGPFSFLDEYDGEDATEGDFCQVPAVELLPYDGYRTEVDADDDSMDDYEHALATCADSFATAILACGTPGDLGDCVCVQSASKARTDCEADALIAMVTPYLGIIGAEVTHRTECCGGGFAKAAGACQAAYLGAAVTFEPLDLAALKAARGGYYTENIALFCPGGAMDYEYSGVEFHPVSENWENQVQRGAFAGRFAHQGAAQRTRAKCLADAEADDMVRRDICPAEQHRCEAKVQADFDYAYGLCEGEFLSCAPEDTDCFTGANTCFLTALHRLLLDRVPCCEREHPAALNGHAKAECKRDAYEAYIVILLPCCSAYSTCIAACGSDPASVTDCTSACDAARAACEADATLDLSDCTALKGDCPDCFDGTVTLTAPPPPTCTLEHPLINGCVPLDEHGYCPGVELPGCPEDTSGCGVGGECCPTLEADENHLIISCSWFSTCHEFFDGRGEADLPEGAHLCPDPLPAAPLPGPCKINIS